MKMKKSLIALGSLIAVSSMAVHADEDLSEAHLTWNGYVNIIPGDSFTITAENGSMMLEDGELNIETTGVFSSTPIILEGHSYTRAGDGTLEIGDFAEASWKVDTIDFKWGSNAAAALEIAPNVTLTEDVSGEVVKEGDIISKPLEQVQFTAQNDTPLATSTVTDLGQEATVKATIVASFIKA